MNEAREAFEAKFGIVGTRMPNGNYSSWIHQAKWEGYQASWQEQQKRIDQLEMNLRFVIDHFVMNDLDKAMPRLFEEMQEVLRGEA